MTVFAPLFITILVTLQFPTLLPLLPSHHPPLTLIVASRSAKRSSPRPVSPLPNLPPAKIVILAAATQPTSPALAMPSSSFDHTIFPVVWLLARINRTSSANLRPRSGTECPRLRSAHLPNLLRRKSKSIRPSTPTIPTHPDARKLQPRRQLLRGR